jgi:hypothetical protein
MIAAIDPGTSGGIAWQWASGQVETCTMANRGEFLKALREYHDLSYPFADDPSPVVFIEHVTGYVAPRKVKPGEKEEFSLAGSGFAMFNFGKSAGVCFGICEAFAIVPKEVSPRAWQSALFGKKSGTRQQWKGELKSIAERRFPSVKVTLANCDALLILSYAILLTRGSIQTAPSK